MPEEMGPEEFPELVYARSVPLERLLPLDVFQGEVPIGELLEGLEGFLFDVEVAVLTDGGLDLSLVGGGVLFGRKDPPYPFSVGVKIALPTLSIRPYRHNPPLTPGTRRRPPRCLDPRAARSSNLAFP